MTKRVLIVGLLTLVALGMPWQEADYPSLTQVADSSIPPPPLPGVNTGLDG